MRIQKSITNNIPPSLATVLMFLSLNMSFFLLFELLFSLIQFNFSSQNVSLSNELILLAVLLSNCLLIVLILVFLHFKGQEFSSSFLLKNFTAKSAITVITVSVAFIIFLKYELFALWAKYFGETKVDLFPWPFHLFEPEIHDISYLIFFTLIFVVIQPFWEELLFRRILAGSLLKQGFNQTYSVILSSFAYSLYFVIYLLVEVSLSDLLLFLFTSIILGVMLGASFVYTQRIRYSYIISSLINAISLLLFLSKNHFEFTPYREVISVVCLVVILLSLLIVLFLISRKVLDGTFISTIKKLSQSILTFRWPAKDHLRNYWKTIVFLIPIIPLSVHIFIDHTVLYSDLFALVLENGFSFLILMICSIFLYQNISTNLSIFSNNEISTLKLSFAWFSNNSIFHGEISLKAFLRRIHSRFVFLILTVGVISPFYILSVVAKTKVEVIILWQAFIDISILIIQNPFFTYQHVVTEIRSNIIFIGNKTEVIDSFYFFQQSLGKWNFLPDTYMSNNSDWIHGLLTVILWIGIITLYVYLLRKSGQYPLKSALGAMLLVVMNFVWILFALGFGSLSPEGEPLGLPSLKDISFLVKFDISIEEFLILPLGLLLFLIVAIIIVIQHLKRRKNEESINSRPV